VRVAGSEVSTAQPGRFPAQPHPVLAFLSTLRPTWSVPAAMRAARATIVVPALFALTLEVIGDLQMALFAVFGAFATLVLASFGGTRRDKLIAHLGLAVVGSVVLTIGTAVSGTAWLAAIVTIPVAFGIFFAGAAGPNAASGVTAALLAYVLPVATPSAMGTVPSRLAGWWLAAVVSTAAVLLLSPKTPGDRLRAAAAACAAALADHLAAAAHDEATPALLEATRAAKHELVTQFAATPYRPTGLATADQALASVVQLLEWCTALVSDALDGHLDLSQAAQVDRDLLGVTGGVLRDVAALLKGQDAQPDLDGLERARAASAAHQRDHSADPVRLRLCTKHAFHAQAIAVAARALTADTLIVTGRASPEVIAAQRRTWFGVQAADAPPEGRLGGLAGAAGLLATHASLRSTWLRNSLRGAVGLALAVAVADVLSVQHGFWVVLGTLSVLRTNAASTGSTALRALAGTVVGFVVGAALLLAIGTGPTALWIALPVAVLIASYAPGTAPFAVGQAAFTVTVLVLFNLLAPAGWTVGLLRVEDVAIGCVVSLVVGALFWPRGASGIVGDDLADAYRGGAAYLTEAVDWALGLRGRVPEAAGATAAAGLRLDDAVRAYLAEQGSKRLAKEDLWLLVMASMRLRLTAYSLASLRDRVGSSYPDGSGQRVGSSYPDGPGHGDGVRAALRGLAGELDDFYERIATQVGRPAHGSPLPAEVPVLAGISAAAQPGGDDGLMLLDHPHALWVREHLHHLAQHAVAVPEPAHHVAELRRTPWWR
jgi:uncharacterized membrane protein YccC